MGNLPGRTEDSQRVVRALKRAGLLEVYRGGRGRCAEVTIVEKVTEPSVAPA